MRGESILASRWAMISAAEENVEEGRGGGGGEGEGG